MKKIAFVLIICLLMGALGVLFNGIADFPGNSSDSSTQSDSSNSAPSVPTKPDNEQGGQTVFSNLSIAFLGDSITKGLCKGQVMETPYPQGVANTLGIKTVTNLGIGGSTLCTKNYNSMVSRYSTVPEGTDIIGIHGGVNDWAQAFELGDITSTNTRTIYGALDYLAKNLKATYPDAFIFFMTPTPVSDAKLEQYSATPYSLADVSQAMKDVAEKYGFLVLDLYALSGFENVCNDTSKTDGVHPYQEFTTNSLVPLISEFIRENYTK